MDIFVGKIMFRFLQLFLTINFKYLYMSIIQFSRQTNRKFLFILILTFVFISCARQEKKQQSKIIESKDSVSTDSRLERWLSYYQIKLLDFTDTLAVNENKLVARDYNSETDSLYKEFFVLSPDYLYAIDLDSYGLTLERNAQGNLISYGFEVDTEVSLKDLKKKLAYRLLFCGPSCIPQESYWMNSDLVYILGFSDENNSKYPTIWSFKIREHRMQEIRYISPIDLKGKNYVIDIRLKKITF